MKKIFQQLQTLRAILFGPAFWIDSNLHAKREHVIWQPYLVEFALKYGKYAK